MSAEQDKIPTSKVERASRVFRTSMKVGANYIKHNAQKAVGSQVDENSLNEKNACFSFPLYTFFYCSICSTTIDNAISRLSISKLSNVV